MSRLKIFFKLMELQYEVSRLSFKYQNTPRKYSTDEDLYMMEMHLLNSIGDNEGISMSELAKISNRTLGAISQKINKLGKKGFVEKKINKTDPKVRNIFLTPKGKQAFFYHKELDLKNYTNLLNKLPDFTTEDFNKMIALNKLIIKSISKEVLD